MAWLSGLAFVAVAVSVALGGMLWVRHSVQLSTLEEHREVAGFVCAVIGVVYAVLLTFVVALVWQQQEEGEIEENVDRQSRSWSGRVNAWAEAGQREPPLRARPL